MDMSNIPQAKRQDAEYSSDAGDGEFLDRADRRLLLGAGLRALSDRFHHGRPIFQEDLERIASFTDDSAERAI